MKLNSLLLALIISDAIFLLNLVDIIVMFVFQKFLNPIGPNGKSWQVLARTAFDILSEAQAASWKTARQSTIENIQRNIPEGATYTDSLEIAWRFECGAEVWRKRATVCGIEIESRLQDFLQKDEALVIGDALPINIAAGLNEHTIKRQETNFNHAAPIRFKSLGEAQARIERTRTFLEAAIVTVPDLIWRTASDGGPKTEKLLWESAFALMQSRAGVGWQCDGRLQRLLFHFRQHEQPNSQLPILGREKRIGNQIESADVAKQKKLRDSPKSNLVRELILKQYPNSAYKSKTAAEVKNKLRNHSDWLSSGDVPSDRTIQAVLKEMKEELKSAQTAN